MTCVSSGGVSGARLFANQATEDGFAVDPFAVEVGTDGTDGMATVVFAVGDALGGARGLRGSRFRSWNPGGRVVWAWRAPSPERHATMRLTTPGRPLG